jgi:hypothetical protein
MDRFPSKLMPPHLLLKDMAAFNATRKIPVGALKDILNFQLVHKSPYSKSFYDRSREWNVYEDGCVRIADHWNFKVDTGKIHGKTIGDWPNLRWAKGIYRVCHNAYEILEVYEKSTREEHDEFVRNFLS